MIEEVLESFRKIYKNPLYSRSTQENGSIDYQKDTEFILNQITPDDSDFNENEKEAYISKSVPKEN